MEMLPYIALMAVPVLFGLATAGGRPGATLAIGFVVFTLFAGLRYEVGPDWSGYLVHFDLVDFKDLAQIWTETEPGYWTLVWFAEESGIGMVGVNLIASAIFFAGLFAFANTTDRPWIAVAVATAYLVLALGMSGIRQAMAMGFIFLMLASWPRTGNWQKAALIGIAALFHFSAVLMLALLAFGQKTGRIVQIGGAALGLGALVYVARSQTDAVQLYVDRYVGVQTVQATGAIFHALLNAIPAAGYLLLHNKWNQTFGPNPLLFALAVGSVALIPMLAISTVGVSRVAMYLTPAAMMIWAGMPRVLGGERGSGGYVFGAFVAQFVTMVVWLTFANVAFTYFPYQNVLFSG